MVQLNYGDIDDVDKKKEIFEYIDKLDGMKAEIKLSSAKDCEYLSDAIKEFCFKSEKKGAILFANNFRQYLIDFENTKQLFALLDEFTTLVNEKKRSTGNLTFSDVSAVTLDVFKNHKEILASQKNLFKRVMIDETQDNNGDNFDLLKQLGVPAFYVGDTKQSIYRFRGAEVDKFNELQKNEAIVKHITTNYRSNKYLINCFNQIFGGFVADEKIDGGDKYVFPESSQENYKACFTKYDIAKVPTDKKDSRL